MKPVAYALAALVASCLPANAATLFVQQPVPTNGVRSSVAEARESADDFRLTIPALITSISWLGFDLTDDPGVDDFAIRFYSDDAGVPGVLLRTFSLGSQVEKTPAPPVSDRFPSTYWYVGDLGPGFRVPADTTFWVSVTNVGPWAWGERTGAGNAAGHETGEPWRATIYETVFTLEGTPGAIPEPTSLILLASGIAGLALYRRRS